MGSGPPFPRLADGIDLPDCVFRTPTTAGVCRAEGPDGDKLRVRANNLRGRHHHFFKLWIRRTSDHAVIRKWNVHVPKRKQRFRAFPLPTTRELSYAIRDRYQPGTEVGSTTEFGPTLCRW